MIDTPITSSSGLSAQSPISWGEHVGGAGQRKETSVNSTAPMPMKNSCAEVETASVKAVDQARESELTAQETDRHREERAGGPAFGRRHHAGIRARR